MNKQLFLDNYYGKPVIIIGDDKTIYATIEDVIVTGVNNSIALVIFKNSKTGKTFSSSGIVLEDNEKTRAIVNYASSLCAPKELWEVFASIKVFDKNMDYFAEFYCIKNGHFN